MNKKKKNLSLVKKVLLITIPLGIIITAVFAWKAYRDLYQSNIFLKNKKTTFIYIPTGSNFNDVKHILYDNGYIVNQATFEFFAEKKNYINNVKPGKYLLKENMSNNQLINMLRSGAQTPVKLTFNNIRTKEKLAGIIGKLLEPDSLEIIQMLNDGEYLKQFGANSATSIALFIPNTYELYWNTSSKQFFERMFKEYEKFWTKEREQKAKNLNLTKMEVATLASIVQEETNKFDEMPRVAGVYLNRINKDMPLQADPTVKFAVGDFTLKRILNSHLQTESPYNTYLNVGLPPGPICMPDSRVILKVLDAEKHDYFYFCAKDDMSGYHAFAKTYQQHLNNANSYHKKLNSLKIR